jgi:hypothetical protein
MPIVTRNVHAREGNVRHVAALIGDAASTAMLPAGALARLERDKGAPQAWTGVALPARRITRARLRANLVTAALGFQHVWCEKTLYKYVTANRVK